MNSDAISENGTTKTIIQISKSNRPTKIDTSQTISTKLNNKRRRSKYEKPINAIWELFSDYSNTSTIHGVRYLGEKRRHWTERIWWIVAFAISLIVCGKLILDTWKKWDRFPVIVTFAEKSTPIWEIPFPSVTICPETKVKQTIFNYTSFCNIVDENHSFLNLTEEEIYIYRSAAKICHWLPKNLTHFDEQYSSNDVFGQLRKLAPSLSDVVYKCQWQGQLKSCNKVFSDVWTEEGLCFTFNFLNSTELEVNYGVNASISNTMHEYFPKNWSTSNGYVKQAHENDVYPLRVFGASDGLFVYLRLYDKDIDYLCGGPVQGFKILLHTPGEIPQISKYFYRIPLDHEVIVSVKPILMTTSETLSHYSSKRRKCFLEFERKLKFFKMYTQRNCELECITNATLKRCGCVTFSMPRTNSTQICGLAKLKCYADVEMKVSRRNAVGNLKCHCLPACSSVSYDAELSFAKYELRKYYKAQRINYVNRRQYARIFISFKDNQFFASRRSELYGRADFLANCGGLLGLFMGFSLLSLIEMIYYCTLRLACNLKKRQKRKKLRMEQINYSMEHERY